MNFLSAEALERLLGGAGALRAAEGDVDWYERQDELEPEQVFNSCAGIVKLDRRVPGDGTKWYVADWSDYTKSWGYYDSTIEPGDLTRRLPDDFRGEGS